MRLFTIWFRKRCARAAGLAIIFCLLVVILLMMKVENHEDLKPGKMEETKFEILMKQPPKEFHEEREKIFPFDKNKNNTRIFQGVPQIIPDYRDAYKDTVDFDPLEVGSDLNYNVHVFYYPWYGNPKNDRKFLHWNHPILPHWNKLEAAKWPEGSHSPPEDIGANFYPFLGPYSSSDPHVIQKHMREIATTGVGVVVVSWYPPKDADDQGKDPDKLIPLILEKANRFELKVAFHIEPFKERNHITLRKNLKYIIEKYGQHSAFYKQFHVEKNIELPVFYIYDSYQVKPRLWAQIFKPEGRLTVRNTELDGIFIGLVAEKEHLMDIAIAGFDGLYTYFASKDFTYGSSWKNWKQISKFAETRNLYFIPSIGPGYIDTNIRPWNGRNSRARDDGKYYLNACSAALETKPKFLSITSYNEWHEGTQIEPAVPRPNNPFIFLDYGSKGPNLYLHLTKQIVKQFTSMQVGNQK